MTDSNLELQESGWEELRREARKIEGDLDVKLSSYAKLGARFNQGDGKIHPLTYIHHTSTYQASMCKLIEYCLSPATNALQDRLRDNEIRVRFWESLICSSRKSSVGSPRQVSSHTIRGSGSLSPRDMHSPSEPYGLRSSLVFGSRTRKVPH